MPYKDPEKQRAYLAKHYRDNVPVYVAKARKSTNRYRIRNKNFVYRYKRFCGCYKCGYKRSMLALEFHHHNDDKENNVAHMCNHTFSIKAIKAEIRKCVLLCANCHREEHDDKLVSPVGFEPHILHLRGRLS